LLWSTAYGLTSLPSSGLTTEVVSNVVENLWSGDSPVFSHITNYDNIVSSFREDLCLEPDQRVELYHALKNSLASLQESHISKLKKLNAIKAGPTHPEWAPDNPVNWTIWHENWTSHREPHPVTGELVGAEDYLQWFRNLDNGHNLWVRDEKTIDKLISDERLFRQRLGCRDYR